MSEIGFRVSSDLAGHLATSYMLSAILQNRERKQTRVIQDPKPLTRRISLKLPALGRAAAPRLETFFEDPSCIFSKRARGHNLTRLTNAQRCLGAE